MTRRRKPRLRSLPPGLLFASGLLAGAAATALLLLPGRNAPAVRPVVPRAASTPAGHPTPGVSPPSSALVFPPGHGQIAIVLDDWGYHSRHIPALSSIRRPLTIAVLPNLPYSKAVAQAARASGHEVILHMPMQPLNPQEPREEGTILAGMSQEQIASLLDRALAGVPQAKGISNHQGSRVTADRQTLETVLREVKRRRLYFLDSFVTKDSVGPEVARRIGVPFAQRAVFLDNESGRSSVREQLAALARLAGLRGQAIGIGHDRPATLAELERAIPALEKAGYRLVPVSKLLEGPSDG